ncbi:hypothetical protein BST91_07440 [Nonlabens tegetincola]|uniref:hypothetical protein n=1 Tax=Nonlabens tegetincola TaxID=323273 RepID=UPI000A209ED0|nr:hypothetical protein [Nonlabens tegetincola]ARN71481.1 hypothetical protein BST91_07440 [Nonlabens tegetincola]
MPLTDDDDNFFELFTNNKVRYFLDKENVIEFSFRQEIDTLILDNRGIINSHYFKSYLLHSNKKDLQIKIVKSNDGSSFVEIILFNNKTFLNLENLENQSEIKKNHFETHNERPLDYMIIDKNKGITEFKFEKDSTSYKLISSKA